MRCDSVRTAPIRRIVGGQDDGNAACARDRLLQKAVDGDPLLGQRFGDGRDHARLVAHQQPQIGAPLRMRGIERR